MTILDTFLLVFKTDIPKEAGADIAKLDKQLDEMGKKGKKRTEDENKQYEVLKKQRKELLDATKQQRQETDKLGDSFAGMIENAVGAVTAYATFGALKTALIDANKLNSSLTILGKTFSQSPRDIKAFGQALQLSGGDAQSLYNFVAAEGTDLAGKRLPFDLKRAIENIHTNVQNDPSFLTKLLQVPGGAGLAPLVTLPDGEFRKKLDEGFAFAGSDKDFQAALANEKSASERNIAFGKLATEVDTDLAGVIKRLNAALTRLAETFEGHPGRTEAAGLLGALGGLKLGKWLSRGLFGRLLGGGAVPAASEGLAGAGGVGLAFPR
ncbi:hypothetical protein [Fimbriiglobus ruber]|uniref:Uncharacterized protein n=1 Tax=Fimbriiglobus ruber TaxID=1908690 RepID=A0A225DYY1_9BACT|nr:hypothetical protein [Fimbriiglobus ruber]OWK42469.1 hypothetical protein FRUB_04547 [Fimbriiglobus ruber]